MKSFCFSITLLFTTLAVFSQSRQKIAEHSLHFRNGLPAGEGKLVWIDTNNDLVTSNAFTQNLTFEYPGSFIFNNAGDVAGQINANNPEMVTFAGDLWSFNAGSSQTELGINTNASDAITLNIFSTNATAALKVAGPHGVILQANTNGNVGIGTNGPAARLHVVKATAATIGFRLDDTNFTPRLQIDTLPGFSSYVAIWGGNVTPTVNNFVLATDGNTDLSLNVPNSGGSIKFNAANANQWTLSGTSLSPAASLVEDIGTSSLLVRTQNVGWVTKINENILTNTITSAATLYVDLGTNGVQFLNLAGDSTVHTTNRTGSAGFRGTTVFVKGAATNCVLTLNTNWITFGTNNTVTALANKWMVFTFGVKGTAEADVLCSYDSQKN